MADLRGTYITAIALVNERAGDRSIVLDDLDPNRRNSRIVALQAVERMRSNVVGRSLDVTVQDGPIFDSLSGTKDDSNKTFTIANSPLGVVVLNHNNALVTEVASSPGVGEFSISDKTITMGLAPSSGDSLVAWYVRQ